MKRILLTGADGFLGKLISQSLQHLGHTVIPSVFDIRDENGIQEFLRKQDSFDLTIHLAAMSSVPDCEKNPTLANEINVQGALNVASRVVQHSPKSGFIFFSSAQIYDWSKVQGNEKATEDFPIHPGNVYAQSKFEAEKQLSKLFEQTSQNLVLLRLFNHTHATQSPNFFLPSVYHQILKGIDSGKVTLSLGETSLFRDIGAVQDLLTAIGHLVEKQTAHGAYNICSGTGKKLSDLIFELSKSLKVEVAIEKNPQFLRKNDPLWICGSYAKFERDFGWKPRHGENAQSLISAFLEKID